MAIISDSRPLVKKKAFILGGTGGIGRAVVNNLARHGADVIVHGGGERARLESALAAARAFGVRAEGVLSRLETAGQATALAADFLPFDILVVSFGPLCEKELHETTAGEWERQALLNYALPGALVSACLPSMVERGWGRILLFGGTGTDGLRGYTRVAAYAGAKTALGVLVKSVARAYGDRGIVCGLVCPGVTATEYSREEDVARWSASVGQRAPLDPARVADAAVRFLVDARDNGSVFRVDGGQGFDKRQMGL